MEIYDDALDSYERTFSDYRSSNLDPPFELFLDTAHCNVLLERPDDAIDILDRCNKVMTLERDQLYSLALYYLIHGNHTYYGYGTHGNYELDEERWFDAINYDIGQPLDSYYIYDDGSGYTKETVNSLINGNFEIDEESETFLQSAK